jgi:nucleotide-binding universal stress UspA family protein
MAMYSTLMVYLEAGRNNAPRLAAAAELARRFEAGVVGIAASEPTRVVYGTGTVPDDVIELNRTDIAEALRELEAAFHEALRSDVKWAAWRSHIGVDSLHDYVARQARCADLIVTGPDSGDMPPGSATGVGAGDLVIEAGRPVLVIPEQPGGFTAQNVLVAWKDTREARRAVSDALPFLKAAARVTVAEVAGGEEMSTVRERLDDVVAWLGRQDVAAEGVAESAMVHHAERLNAIADGQGADLMVAGAYGHSRLREWVLGGVTRDLLSQPRRSTLVSH